MKLIAKYCSAFVLVFITGSLSAQNEKLLIAAASDLKFALDSIVSVYRKKHSTTKIEITYGSSGKLFEQISNGGPFDMFFSADIDYPKQLQSKGLTQSEVQSYGKGRIVLWSKKIDPSNKTLIVLLDPAIKKIAIANPVHAPYGKRAKESLTYYKLFDKVSAKLVYGENISQTAQFVTTGAADAGIIALSLAKSPAMQREKGSYFVIPEESHQPLVQGFAILKHAKGNRDAEAFAKFIMDKNAKEILTYFGFAELQ